MGLMRKLPWRRCSISSTASLTRNEPVSEQSHSGLAAAAGVAVGPAFVLRGLADASRTQGSAGEEKAALESAVASALLGVSRLIATLDGEAADIMGFQAALLEDDALTEGAYAAITAGSSADEAWRRALDAEIVGYEASGDEYFQARAADLADVRDRVLRKLMNLADADAVPAAAILLAADIPPSAFLAVDWSKGGGIVLGDGSPTSHVAMLARGRGVPMVVGLGTAWHGMAGDIFVDGTRGIVVSHPSAQRRALAKTTATERLAVRAAAEKRMGEPAITRDGTAVRVLLNVSSIADVTGFPVEACDGIGLVRTEFLVEGALRDENIQYARYVSLIRWASGRPVTIRTLDAGGDKPIAGYTLDGETNPFLGLRGIRLSLRHPDVFRIQLRALARAAVHGPLKVMLPMITHNGELEEARGLFKDVIAGLEREGIAHAEPDLGIMVEVPAAAMAVGAFRSSFFSIGSNDLTQYACAASRDGTDVARYADVLNPGVMAMIAHVADYGAATDLEVSVCGDAAGDTRAVEALLQAGVRTLSLAPGLLAETKAVIRKVDLTASRPLP
jgi:phosphoenolpyruvate-protein phosphotransferase (PTS system enzyme I)